MALAYVTNLYSNSVSLVDLDVLMVIATIPVGKEPVYLDITPDGQFVYVANYLSNNVSVIYTGSNKVIATIPVAYGPYDVKADLEGKYVYITNRLDLIVSIISVESQKVVKTFQVKGRPYHLDLHPYSNMAYLSTWSYPEAVSIVDLNLNREIKRIRTARWLEGIAVAPRGKFVYIVNHVDGRLLTLDTATNTLSPVEIITGHGPVNLVLNKTGKWAYITNAWDDTVSVIDISTNLPKETIKVGMYPDGIDLTPDDCFLVVANRWDDNVAVIDLQTGNIANIPVGDWPRDVKILKS